MSRLYSYETRSFPVQARQVTAENYEELGEWVGAKAVTVKRSIPDGNIEELKYDLPKGTRSVSLGSWFVLLNRGEEPPTIDRFEDEQVLVYRDEDFHESFRPTAF